jgi:hypothetical protein
VLLQVVHQPRAVALDLLRARHGQIRLD